MSSIRRFFSITLGKLTAWIRTLFKGSASVAPGKVALTIYPDLIKDLSAQLKQGTVVICGTNGKTTTTNLIERTLRLTGKSVVCNRLGANMENGIATAFINASTVGGKVDADWACIEIDEFAAAKMVPLLKPDFMVLTNLFRDQLDRYGEIDTIMQILIDALKNSQDTKLIYNADDPLVSYVANQSGQAYKSFGIGEDIHAYQNRVSESPFCRVCGAQMEYHFRHYGQLGDFSCPSCGFSRKEPEFEAMDIHFEDKTCFTVQDAEIKMSYKNAYMIYNVLAAYTLTQIINCKTETYQKVLDAYAPDNGRLQKFNMNKPVILNLAKNPTGMNQNVEVVVLDTRKKSVIILVNDNDADGTDISWIWDVDFERLKDTFVALWAGGTRSNDLQLRFKYADLQADTTDNLEDAVQKAIQTPCDVVYVITNYTALAPTKLILERMEGNQKK